MREFEYGPPIIEPPAPETPTVTDASPEQIQEPPVPASRGRLVGATADFIAADLGYTVLKGMTLGLDVAAALKGKKRWKAIRWDPTDEDVEGISPSLDKHRQEAKARLQEEIVVWERQKASNK
jgi:hypothetical protein